MTENQIEKLLNQARDLMLVAEGSVAVLPDSLCHSLVDARKQNEVEFQKQLDKLDMSVNVISDQTSGAIITISIVFYPSMECFGPCSAAIYISPSFLAGAMRRNAARSARKTITRPGLFSRVMAWIKRR